MRSREPSPSSSGYCAVGELAQARGELLAERRRRPCSPRATPMTAKFSGNKLRAAEIVERRHQQALGQIPRGAENDEDARAARDWARAVVICSAPSVSTWPPNLLRIAESSLSEKLSCSRERKRA